MPTDIVSTYLRVLPAGYSFNPQTSPLSQANTSWAENTLLYNLQAHQPDFVVEGVRTEVYAATGVSYDIGVKCEQGELKGKILTDTRKSANDEEVIFITTINGAHAIGGMGAKVDTVFPYEKYSYKYGRKLIDRKLGELVDVFVPGVGTIKARVLIIAESQYKRKNLVEDFGMAGISFYITRRGFEPVVDGLETLFSKSVTRLADATFQSPTQELSTIVVRNQDLKSTDPRLTPQKTVEVPQATKGKEIHSQHPKAVRTASACLREAKAYGAEITSRHRKRESRYHSGSDKSHGNPSTKFASFRDKGPKYAPRTPARKDYDAFSGGRGGSRSPNNDWFHEKSGRNEDHNRDSRLIGRWGDHDKDSSWRHRGDLAQSPQTYSPRSPRQDYSHLNPLAEPYVGLGIDYSSPTRPLGKFDFERTPSKPLALEWSSPEPARGYSSKRADTHSRNYTLPRRDATNGNASPGPSGPPLSPVYVPMTFRELDDAATNGCPPSGLPFNPLSPVYVPGPFPSFDDSEIRAYCDNNRELLDRLAKAPVAPLSTPSSPSFVPSSPDFTSGRLADEEWAAIVATLPTDGMLIRPDGSEWEEIEALRPQVQATPCNTPTSATMEVDEPLKATSRMKISSICGSTEEKLPVAKEVSTPKDKANVVPVGLRSGRNLAVDYFQTDSASLTTGPSQPVTTWSPWLGAGVLPSFAAFNFRNISPGPILVAGSATYIHNEPEAAKGYAAAQQLWKDTLGGEVDLFEEELEVSHELTRNAILVLTSFLKTQHERVVTEKNGVRFYHPFSHKLPTNTNPEPAKTPTSLLTRQLRKRPHEPLTPHPTLSQQDFAIEDWVNVEKDSAMEEESDSGAYDLYVDHESHSLTKDNRARKVEKKRTIKKARAFKSGDALLQARAVEKAQRRALALQDHEYFYYGSGRGLGETMRSCYLAYLEAGGKKGELERKAMIDDNL
ncbi:hypothetical protein P7C70_g1011, partial [Phenoliferia sp. Uapishka_3]